jgi:hypothetical protein
MRGKSHRHSQQLKLFTYLFVNCFCFALADLVSFPYRLGVLIMGMILAASGYMEFVRYQGFLFSSKANHVIYSWCLSVALFAEFCGKGR